jgi:hypothetical protein
MPEDNKGKVPSPQHPTLVKPYVPGQSNVLDFLHELYLESFRVQVETTERLFYSAEVWSVSKGFEWFGLNTPEVRVRARIRDSEGVHMTLPTPKNTEDNAAINQLPEFVASLSDLGGRMPVLNEVIRVSFRDPRTKTKIYGNGIITSFEVESKVAGGLSNVNPSIPVPRAFTKNSKLLACLSQTKKSSAKPSDGGAITGENESQTIGENSPRKLNSPTSDAGAEARAKAAAGAVPAASATPKPAKPPAAENKRKVKNPNSDIDCEKIYPLREFATAGTELKDQKPVEICGKTRFRPEKYNTFSAGLPCSSLVAVWVLNQLGLRPPQSLWPDWRAWRRRDTKLWGVINLIKGPVFSDYNISYIQSVLGGTYKRYTPATRKNPPQLTEGRWHISQRWCKKPTGGLPGGHIYLIYYGGGNKVRMIDSSVKKGYRDRVLPISRWFGNGCNETLLTLPFGVE